MSVMYDNRNRTSTRLKQLRTGRRYVQAPPSNLPLLEFALALLAEHGFQAFWGAQPMIFPSSVATSLAGQDFDDSGRVHVPRPRAHRGRGPSGPHHKELAMIALLSLARYHL